MMFDEDQLTNDMTEDTLNQKIEEIRKSREVNVNDSENYEIKYQGVSIPIKNEKVKFTLNKINEISEKIEEEKDISKKINTFSEVFNHLDEIVRILKKEKSEEGAQTESKLNLIRFRKNIYQTVGLHPKFKIKKVHSKKPHLHKRIFSRL